MWNLIAQFVYRTNCPRLYPSQWFVHFNNLFALHSRILNVTRNDYLMYAFQVIALLQGRFKSLPFVKISGIVRKTFTLIWEFRKIYCLPTLNVFVYVFLIVFTFRGCGCGTLFIRGVLRATGVQLRTDSVPWESFFDAAVVALRPLAARHSIFYYFQLNTCCTIETRIT